MKLNRAFNETQLKRGTRRIRPVHRGETSIMKGFLLSRAVMQRGHQQRVRGLDEVIRAGLVAAQNLGKKLAAGLEGASGGFS